LITSIEASLDAPVQTVSQAPIVVGKPEAHPIKWNTLFWIGLLHVGALAAPWTFTWAGFWTCLVLHWVTGGLGICLGFHRLLTHRSFVVPKPVEYLLTFFGTLACQGGVIAWVATHRLHHRYSDTEGDPHSPMAGFFWAHAGWCLTHDKVRDSDEACYSYAMDLAKDPVHRFLHQTHGYLSIGLGVLFWAIGGWPLVVWGLFLRTVLVYHTTWLVNSAAHLWGYRSYETEEQSHNLWWVALVSYGEGWHNNHHAFPTSARHGLRWWEIDVTYGAVRCLQWLRLATNIRLPRNVSHTAQSAS